MQIDMTSGKPMKILMNFAIPVFLGGVFQQFYNMVDAIIVGKFVGTKALAAVGSTGTICFLILGFLMGTTTGITVLTAQKFGAGKMEEMRQSIGCAVWLSVMLAVVMTFFSMLFMRKILVIMNTPEDIFKDAYSYIMVICGGIFVQMFYNLLASILRALGNSRVPLYFLIVAAFLNIILDLVFIIVFNMGAAGAAWATVISQGLSDVLCLLYIIKAVPELHLNRDEWKFRKGIAVKQIGCGVPMGLQFSITAIGTMMVQSSLNMLGAYPVAAFTAGTKVEGVIAQGLASLGTSISTYNAQNIGAGKIERIREGLRAANIIGVVFSIIAGFTMFFCGKYLCYMFISDNTAEVIPMADTYMKVIGITLIAVHFVNVLRSGIQGLGYGALSMLSGIAELIGRGIMAVLAASYSSYLLVCLGTPVAWIVADILLIILYSYVMRDIQKKLRL